MTSRAYAHARYGLETLIFALCAAASIGWGSVRADSWQPSPGHTQVPIWPDAIPDAHPVAGSEVSKTVEDRPVAGRPWVYVERVSRPTMTVYSPQGKNTGVAVVVFPGGGYQADKCFACTLSHFEIFSRPGIVNANHFTEGVARVLGNSCPGQGAAFGMVSCYSAQQVCRL